MMETAPTELLRVTGLDFISAFAINSEQARTACLTMPSQKAHGTWQIPPAPRGLEQKQRSKGPGRNVCLPVHTRTRLLHVGSAAIAAGGGLYVNTTYQLCTSSQSLVDYLTEGFAIELVNYAATRYISTAEDLSQIRMVRMALVVATRGRPAAPSFLAWGTAVPSPERPNHAAGFGNWATLTGHSRPSAPGELYLDP